MIFVVGMLVSVAAMIGGAALMIRTVARRRRPWSDRTTTWLAWAAFVWTLLAGVVLLFAPTVSSSTSVSSSDPMSPAGPPPETVTRTTTRTLLDHEGASVIGVLLVPVIVAGVGAPGNGPPSRRRRITTGWILAGACVLGAASLGIFFLPAAAALLAAGHKTRHHTIAPDANGHAGPSLNPAQ